MGSRTGQCSSQPQLESDSSTDSTTKSSTDGEPMPEPSGPLDERFVYHLTEEGRRALGRRSWRERRNARAREAKEKGERAGTICGRWRGGAGARVPDLRLSGSWLVAAGFPLGQGYVVQVAAGRLIIQAV